MSVIVRNTPDIDPDVVIAGAYQALIANSDVTALVTKPGDPPSLARIYSEASDDVASEDPTKPVQPYVILTLPSVVMQGSYNHPGINALLDVGAYSQGWSTTTVRALTKACLYSLVVLDWTIPGFTLISSSMNGPGTGFRPASMIVAGKMRRGRQFTIRVLASKNPI